MDLSGVIGAVVVVGLLVGVPLAAFRSDRLSRALFVALPVLGIVVILDLTAISTDFHDADGIFDCGLGCSTWHHVVGWTLWLGALLVLALVITVVLRETLRSRSR